MDQWYPFYRQALDRQLSDRAFQDPTGLKDLTAAWKKVGELAAPGAALKEGEAVFRTVQTEWADLSYDFVSVDAFALPAQVETRYYSTIILDPPFGLDQADWDTVSNRPEPLGAVVIFGVVK